MSTNLAIAAALAFLIGVTHSYLGERYIVQPILRRNDLPRLLHNDWFFQRTVRFAWHITTLLFWGLGALLFYYGRTAPDVTATEIIAVTFLVCAVITVTMSKGRHYAWIVFAAIGWLTWAF